MSLEDDLRRSLQARASDVSPDPATFARVQTRIRRGRTFRLAFAGLATALAVAGVAVAAPRLIDRRIEFEPAPFATAPAPDPTISPVASEAAAPAVPRDTRLVFTDGEAVYAMALDGESADVLIPSPCDPGAVCDIDPLRSVTAVADGPDAGDITAISAACSGVRYGRALESAQDIDTGQNRCASSIAFSPSGGHLAWIAQPEPEGRPELQSVDWTGAGPGEGDAGFGLPWDSVSEVSIQDWVETDDGSLQSELVLRGRRNDVVQMVRMPIEQQADGALATTIEAPPVEARPGFVPLAFAASGNGVEHTLEARQSPDGYTEGTIVRRIGAEVDAAIPAPAGMFDGQNFSESNLWMSDSGDAVVFGDAATQRAWYVTYGPNDVGAPVRSVSATISHGELIVMPPADAAPATEVPATTVDVHFGMEGADACTANQKVTREVDGPGVARAALTELLQGPSSRESNEGIMSPFSANTAGALNEITITDGQARVDFADFRAAVDDDSCTKSAMLDSLNKTLFQFPAVESTLFSFEGDADAFETWLGTHSEAPPGPVLDTSKAIYDAALGRDWDALRGLQRETSCTFSDQKEPCVPYWQDLEEQGEDPLGVLVEILEREPARNPDAPIWVWPAEYFDQDYAGPRAGIREDGVWMFYVMGGD